MSAAKFSPRYAKALIDLAQQNEQLQTVYNDVETFNKALKTNRDLLLFLQSPIIQSEKKMTVINKLFGNQFAPITNKFIEIVVRKRRESYLPEIISSFLEQYNGIKKIVNAKLTTAVPINDTIIQQVKDIILKTTGQTQVVLNTKINPQILGGFILEFNDKLFDTSIQQKLQDLEMQFNENKYVKQY